MAVVFFFSSSCYNIQAFGTQNKHTGTHTEPSRAEPNRTEPTGRVPEQDSSGTAAASGNRTPRCLLPVHFFFFFHRTFTPVRKKPPAASAVRKKRQKKETGGTLASYGAGRLWPRPLMPYGTQIGRLHRRTRRSRTGVHSALQTRVKSSPFFIYLFTFNFLPHATSPNSAAMRSQDLDCMCSTALAA